MSQRMYYFCEYCDRRAVQLYDDGERLIALCPAHRASSPTSSPESTSLVQDPDKTTLNKTPGQDR